MSTTISKTSPVNVGTTPASFFQALVNELSGRIGLPSTLANGSTVCKAVACVYDDSNAMTLTLS